MNDVKHLSTLFTVRSKRAQKRLCFGFHNPFPFLRLGSSKWTNNLNSEHNVKHSDTTRCIIMLHLTTNFKSFETNGAQRSHLEWLQRLIWNQTASDDLSLQPIL